MMTNGMKLSVWARMHGLTYKGAYRLFRAGQLPCRVTQLPTGTVIVFPEVTAAGRVAIYGRVSSHDQSDDLQRQLLRLREFVAAKGWSVAVEQSEVGSGLNGARRKLLALLRDKTITTIVVEHRDRLARFGVEYIEAAMAAGGKSLVVMNETEKTDDLVQDFVDVVTSLCARIYGRRSARNRAKRALEAVRED